MLSVDWFINKNYYQIKGYLMKRGFHPTEDRGFVKNTNNKCCFCIYSNGEENVTLYYTVKPGKTQTLICDTIYHVGHTFDVGCYESLKAINEENKSFINYFKYGGCHIWALDTYKKGDKFFIITDFDDNIDSYCLVHCGLFRNNKYIDVDTITNDINDILDYYDYGPNMEVNIVDKKNFLKYLKDLKITIR